MRRWTSVSKCAKVLISVRWLLTDNQGTVSDLAAYNAVLYQTNINDHLVYDAFGNISSQTQPTARPPFTYTGQRFDAVTGLYYDGCGGTVCRDVQSGGNHVDGRAKSSRILSLSGHE